MKVPKMHELAQVQETQQFIFYALNIEAFTSKFEIRRQCILKF